MRKSLWWRLPILLSMSMVAFPAALIYGNALHGLVAGVPMYSNTRLHGVQRPYTVPALTPQSIFSGEFTHDFARAFGVHFPLLAAAVHLKGQFYWSVLHQSPTWYIVVGKHRTLYEDVYVYNYCTRDIARFAPVAQSWADHLARIQHYYAARGKIFLYVLTPSKADIEPEYLPKSWPCGASLHDRRDFDAAYRRILEKAGVNLVDLVETTARAKKEFPFPPFPPGGIHFNTAAAARGVQALIAKLNEVSGWRRMYDFSFDWHMAPPNEVDTDLLDGLDVPYTGMTYQTPSITLSPATVAHCIPVSMAGIGGSFSYQIYKLLQRTACPPSVDFYEYYHNRMAIYPGDLRYPVDTRRRDWMLLDAADVVILEENQELAAHSQYGDAFYRLVEQRLQAKM